MRSRASASRWAHCSSVPASSGSSLCAEAMKPKKPRLSAASRDDPAGPVGTSGLVFSTDREAVAACHHNDQAGARGGAGLRWSRVSFFREADRNTGQRNIAAVLVVASDSFSDPSVVIMVIVVTMVGVVDAFAAVSHSGQLLRQAVHEVVV